MSDTQIDDLRRRILTQVAAGDLSPAEAADRLAELDERERRGPESASPPDPPPPPAPRSEPRSTPRPDRTTDRVVVHASLRSVEIIGDPTVQEAVADGQCAARHDGSQLVFETDALEDIDVPSFRFHSRSPRVGMLRLGRHQGISRPLVVRMNPDLALDARVDAGTLTVRDVRSHITAHVTAGSARLEGFEGPLHVRVAAGSVKARGIINHGDSSIECDAGSVRLHLQPGSSVRVQAEANLGRVWLPDADAGHTRGGWSAGWGIDEAPKEATIGGGEGTLDVHVNLGSASISCDE